MLRLICGLAAAAALLPAQDRVEIRGVYSNPKPFWDTGARLDDYGVNAVFVHHGSITEELIRRARAEGAKVFAEFATLNGKKYVDEHPEAWPINEKGEQSPQATWFMGVCPTEPKFRAYRMKQLEDLLDRFEIDGVWMDYVHWHAQFEDPDPVLPETCFSDTCLREFEAATGLRIPPGTVAEKAAWILSGHEEQWRDWRCSVIVSWAEEMRGIIRRKRPGALLGVYHVPWTDEEFGGARRRILGVDFDALARVVDVFSPMVYHGRMSRPPGWVGEYIEWFSSRVAIDPARGPKLWPIVQAHNDPGEITAGEFGEVLRLGVAGRSTGVMMFTTRSVAEDPRKMRMMRSVYTSWR